MENIEQYLKQIPENQNFIEIKNILESFDDNKISEESLSLLLDFFQSHLIKNPKPAWNLLYCVFDNIDDKKNPENCTILSEIALDSLKCLIVYEHLDEDETLALLDEILLPTLLSQTGLNLLQNYITPRPHHRQILNVDDIIEICELTDQELVEIQPSVRQCLKIVKFIMSLRKVDIFSDISWWSEVEENCELFANPKSALNLTYLKLKRRKNILSFLHQNVEDKEVKVTEDFFATNEILEQIFRLGFKLSIDNYEELKDLLCANEKILRLMNRKIGLKSEIYTLNESMVNQLYLEIFQSTEPTKDFVNSHSLHIRNILKSIEDVEIIWKIFEKNSALIHLRDFSQTSLNSSSSNVNCHQMSLKAILDSMRTFLTSFEQSNVYRSCVNEMKSKLNDTLKLIDNALWKSDIITSSDSKKNYVEINQLINLSFLGSSEKLELDSTDDEVKIWQKGSFKRKLRKRKKSDVEKKDVRTDDYGYSSDSSFGKFCNIQNEDNIIKKMMMSHNDMINFCLTRNDHQNVDKIISHFGLQDSKVAKLAKYVIHFNNTRLELMEIAKEYPKENKMTIIKSDISELKNFTEKGLIKDDFFQVIRNFMTKNRLKTDDKYLEVSINVSAIITMFISIPLPYELTHDFYSFIIKSDGVSSSYKKFLNNIMEIMTICKNHDLDTNIVDVMRTQTLDFDSPEKFKREIILRKSLIENWDNKSLSKIEKIQLSVQLFEQMECKKNKATKSVDYARNVRQIMKLVTNEKLSFDDIMKLNAHNLIGKILFELQHKPEVIESLVSDHFELMNSIAVMCGVEIENKLDDDEKLLTLFHLKEFSGCSDISLDLKSTENSEKIDIHKLDKLYHLKKKNFFDVKEFINLSCLYDGNRVMTVLNYDHIDIRLILKKMLEMKSSEEKILLLGSISQKQWQKNRKQFCEIFDSYVELIVDATKDITTKIENISKIKDIRKFYELLMKIIGEIDSEYFAKKLLNRCITDDSQETLDHDEKTIASRWLEKVKIYTQVAKTYNQNLSWNGLRKIAEENSNVIANHLLNVAVDYPLCAEFFGITEINVSSEEFRNSFAIALNKQKNTAQHEQLFCVLERFPMNKVVELLIALLKNINNLISLQRIVEFLDARKDHLTPSQRHIHQKFKITARMFTILSDYETMWNLSGQPLLIVEQLLMNLKLDILKVLIREVRKLLDVADYCFACDKSGSEMYQVREVIVCDLDSLHDNMIITNECFDLMLKCYATKALDFEIVDVPSSSDTSTVESIHSNFQMPREIPKKSDWIPDCEAKVCMCCRRQRFSLFSRRHHCRRCGRVVCDDCSKQRVQLPEMYQDLCVRICMECHRKLLSNEDENSLESISDHSFRDKDNLWRLTAIDATDQMIREEFSYDESPSISRCLKIMDFHTPNDEIAKFLIFHCYRLELLLRPIRGRINPEVDIILVAEMMKSLAIAAKVHGNHGEANLIIDHADVIMKVVENGCEYIVPQIPMEKINSVTMRSIINDLIKAENWPMALELSVKFDNSGKTGVFSAWGVSAIKNGKYKLAREKISLAIQTVSGSSTTVNEKFLAMLTSSIEKIEEFNYRRSIRGIPLLTEILDALELTASKRRIQDEFIEDTIGVELEPSIDMIVKNEKIGEDWNSNRIIESPYFEESMYYLINYGGNADILDFLMKNNLVPSALRFVQSQKIQSELFIQHIFVPLLRVDKMESLINYLKKSDPNFGLWKTYLIQTCKYLEKKRAFNSLYQMQTLLGDRVRAALTCIDFYCEGVKTYSELHSKANHLNEAKSHLLTELEKVEWMSKDSQEKSGKDELILKWDLKTINSTINIISLQLEIAKYLADCESNGLSTVQLMKKIFNEKPEVRTLFGKSNERTQVAILLLVCGKSIETGYGISYRIIQECSLKPSRIYLTCTKFLAKTLERLMDIEKLVESIKANSSNEENDMIKLCDDLIAIAVEIAHEQHQSAAKSEIDKLIKLITSEDMKIECYISSNQLKTAYMKSAAMNNLDYVYKILRKSEATRQENIRRLCEKKLQQSSDSMSQCSKSDT